MRSIGICIMVAALLCHAAEKATYKQCMELHKRDSYVVWKNGRCTKLPTEQQKIMQQESDKKKRAEVGILLNGSGACIKDCGSYTEKANPYMETRQSVMKYKPLNSKSMACVYNQIERARIEQKRRSRHCIRNGNIKDDSQREKIYKACQNAELLYSEYYSLIGSDRTCIYRY